MKSYSITNTLDTAYWSTIDGFEDQDGFVATIDRLNLLTSYISPDSSSRVGLDLIPLSTTIHLLQSDLRQSHS